VILTAGLVQYLYRRYTTGLVVASLFIERTGSSPVSFGADPARDGKARRTMTNTQQNLAARRRGEFNRDRGLRRLSQAVDAQRRLNARRADSTRNKADPLGSSDPRRAYLTQSRD
jgi:hypothetical protein